MNSKRASRKHVRVQKAIAAAPAEHARPWLLAALVAICVARPLLPSEGSSWLGDDVSFDLLLLIVAVGYFLVAALRGRFTRAFGVVDGLVAALVAICVASALVGTAEGTPRYAINMLWIWVGQGFVFLLVRQLVRNGAEARAVVAVMFALAVVLSVFGFYQVLVSLPADRAAYAADPEAVMARSLGQVFPPGSVERHRFEDRLQSTEPLATFALANSLAGFLASWLVMALGIGWQTLGRADVPPSPSLPENSRARGPGVLRLAMFAMCLLIVAGCLLLAKSRSAYLAVAFGAALVPWCASARPARFAWRIALGCGVIVLVMIGIAAATGWLDIQVVSEASKSLGYRLEYWRATLSMIANHPWLGVGPGNFQDYYTQFKLPQASEEIRDPHNFLLEVWATAGSFALVALLAVLAVVGARNWHHRPEQEDQPAEPGATNPRGPRMMRNVVLVFGGGAAGLVLAFIVGPPFGYALSEGQLACALAIGGAVGAVLWPWIKRGLLPTRLAALGALVMAINWLAAGGITFPGVAGSFWILLALATIDTTQVKTDDQRPKAGTRWIALGGAAIAGAAAAACYYTAYQPVTSQQAAMAAAERVALPQARLVAYLDAAPLDPLSSDPWMAIAQLELELLKRGRPSSQAYRQFVEATDQLRDLRPRSSATWRQIGKWHLEIYERNHKAETAETALEYLRGAVERYPSSALVRAELAEALELVDQHDAATRQAQRALELDAEMPHADKKLPAETRQLLETLANRPR